MALHGLARFDFRTVLAVAADVSAAFDRAGVPNVEAGGLATFAHGWRAFRADPEILIPSTCERAAVARALGTRVAPVLSRAGFEVWSVHRQGIRLRVLRPVERPSPLDDAIAGAALDREVGIRVLPAWALAAVKLRQDRAKDRADVVELAKAGALPVRKVRRYLATNAPALVEAFDQLVREARREKRRG